MVRWHQPNISLLKRSSLLIIFMILNYFFSAQLGNYFLGSGKGSLLIQPVFWLVIAFLTYSWPGVKIHAQHRYQGFLRFWAFNFAALYILATIIGGLLDGFGRSPYNHSLTGIFLNMFQVGVVLAGRELARNYLTNSFAGKENYVIFVILALFMSLTDISYSRFLNLHDYRDVIEFAAQYLLPGFLTNLLAVYFVYLGGPVPSLIYMGAMQAFQWFMPILPDLKWITAALIGILLPVFSLLSLRGLYDEETRDRRRIKSEEENPISMLITSLVSISIIWFTVGIFPVYPSVVATGSMEPLIMPGDVILVAKVKTSEQLHTGEIIQFHREDILISHRIMEIIKEENSLGYRTKGDNNSGADLQIVKPEDVKGKVIQVIPKIGWPTLLLKSNKSVHLKDVVF